MPVYAFRCPCGWSGDAFVPMGTRTRPCDCGGTADKVWSAPSVIADDIPGGLRLDNYGPEPVTVYSHSERRALMKARGLSEHVRHVGVPGSDHSPHTTNWASGTVDQRMLDNATALVSRGTTDDPDHEPYRSAIRFFNYTVEPPDGDDLDP